jgi:hypothetical protein
MTGHMLVLVLGLLVPGRLAGAGLVMSSLAGSPLLRDANGPLPIFQVRGPDAHHHPTKAPTNRGGTAVHSTHCRRRQIQENRGDGSDNSNFRLWEVRQLSPAVRLPGYARQVTVLFLSQVTPFDVAVNDPRGGNRAAAPLDTHWARQAVAGASGGEAQGPASHEITWTAGIADVVSSLTRGGLLLGCGPVGPHHGPQQLRPRHRHRLPALQREPQLAPKGPAGSR